MLVVMVLTFLEVDAGEFDEKGEDRGVMIITVVDPQLESLIPALLDVYEKHCIVCITAIL